MKKTFDDLKNDQEQKDIYKDNARFTGSVVCNKELEAEEEKLNKWEHRLIEIFPFILFIIILYILL